jgi:hypothetical protein
VLEGRGGESKCKPQVGVWNGVGGEGVRGKDSEGDPHCLTRETKKER